MSGLLDLALQAHGGLERWRDVQSLDVRVSLTGGLVPCRGQYYLFVTRSQGYWMSDDLRQ